MGQYKYKLVETNKFKKQLLKMKNKYKNAKELYRYVVNKLLKGEQLEEKYKNHPLEPKSKRVL